MVLLKSRTLKKLEGFIMHEHWEMTEMQAAIYDKKYNYKHQESTEMWIDRVSGGSPAVK
jgi:methionine salvage enolase-phosphatase E1